MSSSRPVTGRHRFGTLGMYAHCGHMRRAHCAGHYDRRWLHIRTDNEGTAGRLHRPRQPRLGKPVHDQAGRPGRRLILPVLRHPAFVFDGRP